ncbi:hypothetical protein ABZY45_14095 [Streptomyces sp. NPDC006516]|uniref:hypothetical protein n=1 Tax=Streptomyces sp. NPDC006516 TaxID=3154309 RepID=UPI0033A1F130
MPPLRPTRLLPPPGTTGRGHLLRVVRRGLRRPPRRDQPWPAVVLMCAGLLMAVCTGPAGAAPSPASAAATVAAPDAARAVWLPHASAPAPGVVAVPGTDRRGVGTLMGIPEGVTAGVAVFDRVTGDFTELHEADRPFRAASVVKLLLALDYLWDRGPVYDVPQADRDRLRAMLSRSDDAAASHYWATGGGSAVITRMVPRLGLTGTVPPPTAYPGHWGYTATTAADTVRVYRHLLDEAPPPVRDLVLGALRQYTRCAADGFDQHFGLPSAFEAPGTVKQGWSGFTSGGCGAGESPAGGSSTAPGTVTGTAAPANATALDLTSDALHTTGTVGPDDRTVVAVLTLHPDGTPYGTAYSKVTALTGSLHVPGSVSPSGTRFATWGSGVRVRAAATTSATALTTLPAGVHVLVGCQKQGGTVSVPPYVNDWWAYLPQYGGWVTNIYISSPGDTLPGVPPCP